MYGSYGSYSSMCSASITAPMDIASGSFSSRDATCAFPSWPRRSSLDNEESERPTSFLSDDDLNFLCNDPFSDDDTRSISSAGSSSSSPVYAPVPHFSNAEAMEMERERMALQREYVRSIIGEKERRRQQAKRSLKKTSSSKKASPKSKLSAMTPITENGE